jgi:hypothetical protein
MKYELRALAFGFLGAALFHFVQINVFPSASAAPNGILSATGFNLVDTQGRLRAQLGFSKEGPPGFWMMDQRGTARIAMGLYPDETSHLGLQDKNGQMIQLMRSIGSGESPLLIFKHSGEDSMITGLNSAEHAPFLMLYEKGHKRKMQFGTYDGP